MAKLDRPPDRATVRALRGVLDFYQWRGLNVVRRWPRGKRTQRTPGEVASSDEFRVSARMSTGLPAQVVEVYKRRLPAGLQQTWVDYQRATARGAGYYELPGTVT